MEPTEPKYAQDHVLAVSDWYKQPTSVLMPGYMCHASMVSVTAGPATKSNTA